MYHLNKKNISSTQQGPEVEALFLIFQFFSVLCKYKYANAYLRTSAAYMRTSAAYMHTSSTQLNRACVLLFTST